MLLLYIGAALLLGSSGQVRAWRRAEVGSKVNHYYFSVHRDDLPTITEIQEDQYDEGFVLIAAGNAVFRMNEHGSVWRIAGSRYEEEGGYADGTAQDARFNRISGLAQLSSTRLLIADENNQCLRVLFRDVGYVEAYAGACNFSHYYSPDEYIPMKTFNKPSKMVYDSRSGFTFILDMLITDQKYVIISSYETQFNARVNISTHGEVVHSFTYDGLSNSYAVLQSNEIMNISADGSRDIAKTKMADAFGVAFFDGILIVTNIDSGMVTFIDYKQENGNFTICNDTDYFYWGLPQCTLVRPSAVAVINGFLYIGSDYDSDLDEARITKISFTTPGSKKETTTGVYTTPAPWRPVTDPWRPLTDPWSPRTDDPFDPWTAEPDYYDDDYGLSGGTVAIIVVACILGVGLKVCLITWRVRRYTYRVRLRRVATTTVTVHQSNVPYGRLQEHPPPITGNFPTPPPYSASTAIPQSAPPPPGYFAPTSVVNNPPNSSASTTRY
ncbi:uncharacterized protein [Watersipora subatra]|uniref:uncharacterized protein n=1 Tax=Watersipora subatra TaxID=2589382 RepID=UPI00355B0BD7